MASKLANHTKAPPPTKPAWIRSCFGFGSSHKTRVKADRSSDEATTGCGRRMKGLGILRGVIKRTWAKKRERTTSLKKAAREEGRRRGLAVEVADQGSKASKVVVVVANKLDHEFHETQCPIGGNMKKEFGLIKNVSPPTSHNQSKIIKENISVSQETKLMNKSNLKECDESEERRSGLTRVSSRHSRRQSTQRSNMDGHGLVGMLILITILMVMMLCGRVCAIICTAIWLYCMPQLHKTTKSNKNDGGSTNSSVRSGDERKEVVLKGFLERKHYSFPKG